MFVYILASKSRVLYVGVTNDLVRRLWEHRSGAIAGFTRRYGVHKLVYYEAAADATGAIRREKQIKGWARVKKVAMIESVNPGWNDLASAWVCAQRGEDRCHDVGLSDPSHPLGMTRTRTWDARTRTRDDSNGSADNMMPT
ncbi:MAG TPA: GIY-YIG nuclease family protein [Gemmatimonadales bacterium]|nr:GIY-YIG nuclease family protein [Gemmatimonadales bacterium]